MFHNLFLKNKKLKNLFYQLFVKTIFILISQNNYKFKNNFNCKILTLLEGIFAWAANALIKIGKSCIFPLQFQNINKIENKNEFYIFEASVEKIRENYVFILNYFLLTYVL